MIRLRGGPPIGLSGENFPPKFPRTLAAAAKCQTQYLRVTGTPDDHSPEPESLAPVSVARTSLIGHRAPAGGAERAAPGCQPQHCPIRS